MTTYISTNFTLEEASESQTAARLGIDNDIPSDLIDNVKRAAYVMEEVRSELGDNMILVSSWYRSPALNAEVKGSKTSRHMKGLAVDFTCPHFGTPREIVHRLVGSNIKYHQVILEFGKWVHIDFDGEDRQALIIDSTGTRAFA